MKQLGLDDETISKIPDKIEFENQGNDFITAEELKQIKDKYLNIVIENLNEERFTAQNSGEDKIYTLKIDNKEIDAIIVKILENVKEDELIMGKIEQILKQQNSEQEDTTEVMDSLKENIQDMIDELNDAITNMTETEEISINVYAKNKKLDKIEVLVDEEKCIITKLDQGINLQAEESNEKVLEMQLEKIKGADELTYQGYIIPDGDEDKKVTLSINYKGITSLETVEETCVYHDPFMFQDEYSMEDCIIEATYNNKKTFSSNVEKEQFDDENVMLLNGKDVQSMQSIFTQMGQMMSKVQENQETNLNMYDYNTYLFPAIVPTSAMLLWNMNNAGANGYSTGMAIPVVLAGASISMLTGETGIINRANEAAEQARQSEEQDLQNLQENERLTFNMPFEQFKNKQLNSAELEKLMLTVKSINDDEDIENYIEVDSNIGQEVNDDEYEFSSDESGEVSFEYNDDGYIEKIIITGV